MTAHVASGASTTDSGENALQWVKGDNGRTCEAVCAARGRTCDTTELNKLTTDALVQAIL